MKIYLIFCLLVCASALHKEVLKAQWEFYKAEHGKEYHPSVEAHHFNNFIQSTITIEEHNARYHRGEVGYKLGHNKFSDLSHEDMKRKLFGRRKINIEGYYNFTEMPPMDIATVPDSIDWTKNVTPVREQGVCGSCYAFATVAALESAILRENRKRLDLSEQQVIDCSYRILADFNDGCDGGHEMVALDYISKNGILIEKKYPYVSSNGGPPGTCTLKKAIKWGKGLRKHRIQKDDEEELAKAVVTYGPLIVSFYGENDDFKLYKTGIYDTASCSTQTTHNALLIGYGTEGTKKYWLIKNSWGITWGDKGFGKLQRGVNQCGIVTEYPWALSL